MEEIQIDILIKHLTRFGSKGSDNAGTHLDAAQPLFDSLGVTLSGLNYRGSFAFVAVKGSKWQTVTDVKLRGEGPAAVHIVI